MNLQQLKFQRLKRVIEEQKGKNQREVEEKENQEGQEEKEEQKEGKENAETVLEEKKDHK